MAFVVTGFLYAATLTYVTNSFAGWPFFSPRPWNSAPTFVGWFVGQAVSWQWKLFPIRELGQIVVATVYLATFWLFYRAARGRSVRSERR